LPRYSKQKCERALSLIHLLPRSSDTLLRPWIRCLTMIISAWWLRTTSKLSGKKSEKQPENSEMDNS